MPKSLNTKAALELIEAERQRQLAKGHTSNHDDELLPHQLPAAATCHLLCARGADGRGREQAALMWPLEGSDFKPASTRARSLVIAAAFILAAIERELRIDERNRVHNG